MTRDAHLARDFVGYGGRPPDPRWPNGARLALNLVVNFEEGSEASFPDGDGVSETRLSEGGGGFEGRDLAAESMFEYGSRVGFWRINRLLAERDLPASRSVAKRPAAVTSASTASGTSPPDSRATDS